MAGGRPTKYNKEIADRICQIISTSTKGIHAISRENDDIPAASTIMLWLINYPEFSEHYALAKEVQAEMFAEQIITIADDSTHDTMLMKGKDGADYEVENREWVNRSKLRVDSRKWILSKLVPKKYGDKIEQTITGDMKVTNVSDTNFKIKPKGKSK